MERRSTSQPVQLETREGQSSRITGYAAVYYNGTADTEYQLFDNYYERIMPGAFDRAIREKDDVRALFNHDPNQILGRSSAGTVRLIADGKGLSYEIEPGDTTVARDVQQHLKRKDVTGSSFAFTVTEERWVKVGEGKDKRTIREVVNVRLYDVGPVTYPAYTGTSAATRASDAAGRGAGDVDDVRKSIEKFEQQERDQAGRIAGYARRARLCEIA